MANPGDRVRITAKKGSEEGILMPSYDDKVVIIKLDNGYNLGFKKAEIKKLTLIQRASKTIKKYQKTTLNQSLPTISLLHTGGTIASKVDYRTGGVVAAFNPQELLEMFPELFSIANLDSELIAQMWSDDLRFSHFSIIARKIKSSIDKRVKGIIIGIGTDNLSVAAAALSFMIEETPVPIILVGSQRSSDRGSSDSAMNLVCAAEFIKQTDFKGVSICMHEFSSDTTCVILPSCKTYKLHSSRRDAFQAVNDLPIARIDYLTREITFNKKTYPNQGKKLMVKPNMEPKVGLLKIHVNMFPEQFEFFTGYKGLIIEGTGLGHTPGQVPNPEAGIHKKIYPAIQKLIDSGCVVVMTTQCLFGSVNLNVYDKGRDLLSLGVISGKDMLANTALVKLSWLLANYPIKQVKELMGKNLRGEINERLVYENKFNKVQ